MALEDGARPSGARAGKPGGAAKGPVLDVRTNDFALKLANVNGTGSASANGLLMQAIFRMGIPVSGKNLFPSNIQGLPTWYEVRVNKAGSSRTSTTSTTPRRSARVAGCSTTRAGRWTRRCRAPTSRSWACLWLRCATTSSRTRGSGS